MMEPGRGTAILMLLVLSLLIGGCSDDDSDPPPATAIPSAVASATLTATAARTATAAPATNTQAPSSPTPIASASAVAGTPTPSPTPSVTSTLSAPQITFFGISRADDLPLQPTAFDDLGRPIFLRSHGQAMSLVLEAQRGTRPLELSTYDPGGRRRGAEFLVSRPLGDGSPAVCDTLPPMAGGVPGTDPPLFSDAAEVQQAIDDLGCRVNDGTGVPLGRVGQNACTLVEPTLDYAFVDPETEVQFCLPIARAWSFPVGDTIVAARVRDTVGAVSAVREIIVRVEPDEPFVCNQGLGERTFVARRPVSRLISSASGASDTSLDPWTTAPLHICAGRRLSNGVYPLSLSEDAVFGVTLAEGGVLCARISARGSSGTIDCDGGSAADVLAVQDVDALTRVTVDGGLGLDAGTGAAEIRAPVSIVQLAAGATPNDCAEAEYPPPFAGALTTATGIAQVLALDASVVAEASLTGINFDCANWQSGGAGALALPFPFVNSPVGDRAMVLLLAE